MIVICIIKDQPKELVTDGTAGKTREKLLEEQRNAEMDKHVELNERINASIDIVAEKDKKLEDFVSTLAEANARSSELEAALGDYGKITDDIEQNSQEILTDYTAELES